MPRSPRRRAASGRGRAGRSRWRRARRYGADVVDGRAHDGIREAALAGRPRSLAPRVTGWLPRRPPRRPVPGPVSHPAQPLAPARSLVRPPRAQSRHSCGSTPIAGAQPPPVPPAGNRPQDRAGEPTETAREGQSTKRLMGRCLAGPPAPAAGPQRKGIVAEETFHITCPFPLRPNPWRHHSRTPSPILAHGTTLFGLESSACQPRQPMR